MKQKITMVALLLLFVLLSACTPTPPSEASIASERSSSSASSLQKPPKIGISFLTKSLPRWENDGNHLKEKLEAAGYEVELLFTGDSDFLVQVEHIRSMIITDCDVLIVAAADESALSEVLEGAKEKHIPVISYDRCIINSDAVSYHVAFDYTKVGAVQG